MRTLRWLVIELVLSGCVACKPPDEAHSKSTSTAVGDPLQHLVTLNSHGTYSTETFTLPADVYVLVPHPLGFEVPYMLSSPPDRITFEEMLYRQPPGRIPRPSSGGWHVYKPGDVIRNTKFDPWSGSSDTGQEYESWTQSVPKEDRAYIVAGPEGKIPAFALVPARDSRKQVLVYRGIPKMKVKVFGPTDLETVIRRLRTRIPVSPIVLIPFTCNNRASVDNVAIDVDLSATDAFPSMAGEARGPRARGPREQVQMRR
jgi:hypothetical protein